MIRYIANESYIDDASRRQINNIKSKYPNVTQIIVMPDIHAGPGIPIGCTYLSSSVYPELIGSDIGCGMTLFDLNTTKFKRKKFVKRLESFDLCPGLVDKQDKQLGTIGSKNHFAEFQEIVEIKDEKEFSRLNIKTDAILMLVHSGSRNHGMTIAQKYKKNTNGYIAEHDQAVEWAIRNRQCIAELLAEQVNCDVKPVINIVHNYLQVVDGMYIHRKGTGFVKPGDLSIIPGNRGSYTYIVK